MYIKKFIIASCMIILAASCQKVLKVEPEHVLDGSTRFTEISDHEFALIGAYRLFRDTDYYGSFDGNSNAFVTLPDMLSDNLNETGESLGYARVFARWIYAEDENQVENTWLAAYRIIAQANLTLRDIDKFAATDPGAVNRIKGQALAIRGMVHFDVLRYWTDNYDRNATSPGIPYISAYDYEQKPTRGTVKDTYDKIEQDLKTAKQLFTDMDQTINPGGRAYIDDDVVNAILSRVYLYANQPDSAIKYATLVINSYPLADINDFPDIWTDASLDEVVWSYTFDAGQGTPAGNVYAPDVNRSQFRPNPTLVASYDPANDIRFFSYFAVISGRRVLSKYLAKESQLTNPDGTTNFKAFRTGEMYLVRAEAYAMKGAAFEAQALADLNTLRDARIFGYVPEVLAGSALTDAIAHERRKELIAEGHRFFDLKRTTRTINRANCTTFCTLPSTAREWTWPIPQPEIDANPGILPQNTGY